MRGIHHHISYLILNYEIEFFVRLYLRTSPQPPFKCIGLAVGSLGYKYNKGEHLKGDWGKFSPGIPPPTRYKKFYFVIQGVKVPLIHFSATGAAVCEPSPPYSTKINRTISGSSYGAKDANQACELAGRRVITIFYLNY